jgi:hypothetical protein
MHDDGWGVVVLRVINQVLAFLFSPSNSKVRWHRLQGRQGCRFS